MPSRFAEHGQPMGMPACARDLRDLGSGRQPRRSSSRCRSWRPSGPRPRHPRRRSTRGSERRRRVVRSSPPSTSPTSTTRARGAFATPCRREIATWSSTWAASSSCPAKSRSAARSSRSTGSERRRRDHHQEQGPDHSRHRWPRPHHPGPANSGRVTGRDLGHRRGLQRRHRPCLRPEFRRWQHRHHPSGDPRHHGPVEHPRPSRPARRRTCSWPSDKSRITLHHNLFIAANQRNPQSNFDDSDPQPTTPGRRSTCGTTSSGTGMADSARGFGTARTPTSSTTSMPRAAATERTP